MKTSSLIGEPLDWAVAKCKHPTMNVAHFNNLRSQHVLHRDFYYSTNWAHGGPIIEREKISCVYYGQWVASIPADGTGEALGYYGPTPLIAAMRCYVASKLGDEVEIPKELA